MIVKFFHCKVKNYIVLENKANDDHSFDNYATFIDSRKLVDNTCRGHILEVSLFQKYRC